MVKDARTLLLDLVIELRKEGLKVGTSEAIEAYNILKSYASIVGYEDVNEMNIEEIKWVIKSVLVKRSRDEQLFENAWNRLTISKVKVVESMMKDIEKELKILGLTFNEKIHSTRKLLERGTRTQRERRRKAYSLLKRLGIIRRTKGGTSKVISRDEAYKLLERLVSRGYQSIVDAASSEWINKLQKMSIHKVGDEGIAMYMDVDFKYLERLDTSKLARLGVEAIKNRNYKLARKAAELIASRLNMGINVSNINDVLDLLNHFNLLNRQNIETVLKSNPRAIQSPIINKSKYLKDIILRLPPDRQRIILPYLLRNMELSQVVELLDKLPYKALTNISKSSTTHLGKSSCFIHIITQVAQAYDKALQALTEGAGEAYLDYSEYLLDSSMRKFKDLITSDYPKELEPLIYKTIELARLTTTILNSIKSKTPSIAVEALTRRLSFNEALQILQKMYITSDDPNLRRIILHQALRLWFKTKRRIRSNIVIGSKKTQHRTHRLDLKKTIEKLLHWTSQPLIYRDKIRKRKIVLVVDISGSMREYATWTLLAASTFVGSLSRLVLFSKDVNVIEIHGRTPINKIIDILLSASFSGLTNISKAIMEASKSIRPQTLILISDLKQTVKNIPPHKVIGHITKNGWQVICITPPDHDESEAKRITDIGGKVHIIEDPAKIPRILSRYWS